MDRSHYSRIYTCTGCVYMYIYIYVCTPSIYIYFTSTYTSTSTPYILYHVCTIDGVHTYIYEHVSRALLRMWGDNNVKSLHITHKTWLFRQKKYRKQGSFVKRDLTFIQVNQSYPLHPICIYI